MRGRVWEDLDEPFDHGEAVSGTRRASREIWWSVNLDDSRHAGALLVNFHQRELGKGGSFGRLKRLKATDATTRELIHPGDKEVLELLLSMEIRDDFRLYPRQGAQFTSVRIGPAAYDLLLPRICATGRLVLERGVEPRTREEKELARWGVTRAVPDPEAPLTWTGGEPWRFRTRLIAGGPEDYRVEGFLSRTTPAGLETLLPSEVQAVPSCRLLLHGRALAPLDPQGCSSWLLRLARRGPCLLPAAELEPFLQHLWGGPEAPACDLPPETGWRVEPVTPRGHIEIHAPDKPGAYAPRRSGSQVCRVDLLADYGERAVDLAETSAGFLDPESRRIVPRDREAERALGMRLDQLRVHRSDRFGASLRERQVKAAAVPELVKVLVGEGWLVKAEKIPIRSGGRFRFSVSSGIDWFDLAGTLDFGDASAELPDVLAALRSGSSWVLLDDGSHGMIPSEWLARFGPVLDLGEKEKDRLRFRLSQAALLDVLLESEREVQVDAAYRRIRDGLRSFEGIAPVSAPDGFQGTLRSYQETGLGWLGFLRRFGLGGCLADDMGLGKTIQVLAFFEALRTERDGDLTPSLVVAPRSLVYNWIDEAARFTPGLRVLDHTGIGRNCSEEAFRGHHLVLTTYGTLRRDILRLREIPFEYVVLDEAQAIKNADSQSAKASRLLQASHHLALTGTPIENHLGELWSIFEFLNPGMLGSLRAFQEIPGKAAPSGTTADRGANDAAIPAAGVPVDAPRPDLDVLARAVRPFLLRRTKEAVLRELPPKTEQTVLCELSGPERSLYNELRDHFRASLSRRIREVGWNRAKIHVLESLLRLRQAACHPGLLDPKREGEPSAKLRTLAEQLHEVVAEGHKALVFSQFTRFLSIVRRRLEADGLPYEYLDGRTRDRKSRVERFQKDPACPLFLISLKAGGQGLNLTSADYVFLLDPWWNPAVEAQAIDRTHRIGQSRRVFAYRLVARDTVEEKILELQKEKRALSEAILTENEGALRKLTSRDLELLLGGGALSTGG